MNTLTLPSTSFDGTETGLLTVTTGNPHRLTLKVEEGPDHRTADLTHPHAAVLFSATAEHLTGALDTFGPEDLRGIAEAARNLATACRAAEQRHEAVNERFASAIARGQGDEGTDPRGRYHGLYPREVA